VGGWETRRRTTPGAVRKTAKAGCRTKNESDHGFVRPDGGGRDIHVRREHTVGDGPESLEKGDRVTYDTAEGTRSLWARNVSRA
jgi:cold shock CspA family protein